MMNAVADCLAATKTYAAFVWPAYAIAVAVLGGIAVQSWRRYRASVRARRPVAARARPEPMTRKRKRLIMLLLGLAALVGAAALVLAAFSDNLVFFYSPSELAAKPVAAGQRIRIGGLVEIGSVVHQDGSHVLFRVTDGKTDIAVAYDGTLPDLFREGQGVVVEGWLKDGVFVGAPNGVLAKHDERYMPPAVVEELKKTGHWQEGGDPSALAGPPPAHYP